MAFTYLQSATSTADTNAYTFSSQSLGDAASDRYIIVSAVARKAGATFTLSSITIGGVSATIVRQVTNTVTNSNAAAIVIANVPTGTTGDVVVTWSTTVLRCAIGMWRATGLTSATEHDASTSTAADPTYAIDVPAGGFAIAAGLTAAATTAVWTGLTEKFDSTLETFVTYTGASDEFATTQTNLTVTMDFGSANESAGVFASWAVGSSVSVSADVVTTTLSLSAPTITGKANVSADVVSGSLSIPSPTATAIQNVSTNADVVSLSGSIPSPTITAIQNTSTTPDAITLSTSPQEPTTTATQNVSTDADVVGLLASIPSPTLTAIMNASTAADVITLTGSPPTPSITTTRSVSVSGDVVPLTLSIPSASVSLGNGNIKRYDSAWLADQLQVYNGSWGNAVLKYYDNGWQTA
jgi:hypothetical protein